VNSIVQQLLSLQRLDLTIRKISHDLQQIPKEDRKIDEKVASVREPLEEVRNTLEHLETERKELNTSLESLEEKERALKVKMPEIKSNEEYSALLKEMDHVKREKENAEEQALKDMDELEALKAKLPDLEKAYNEGEATVASERAALKEKQEKLEGDLLQKKKDRQALQKDIHPGWFQKYTHIAAQRNGLAVVEVKDHTCQGCFIGIRPKTIQDLRYGEEVLVCEGCQRILYLEDGENGA
jgi:uncharacterized protein